MVPSGWEIKKFSHIMTFRNGLNFTKTDTGEKIKIVGVADFKSYSELSNLNSLSSISVANKVSDDDLIIEKDLLYVRSNGNKDLIGRCLFFPKVNEKLSFSGFTIRGRVTDESTMPEYIALLSRSELVTQQFRKNGGGTNISNLSQQILNDTTICLPPLPEQQKIAKIITTWDQAINTTERLIENSKQQKKALMQQLLTGQKRLEGFNDRWKVFSIEDLEEFKWVELSRGKVISKKDLQKSPGDYPVYSSSIKNEGLMGKYNEYMFDEELISWSVDGGGDFFYRPKHKYSITNVSGYMRLDTNLLNYRFIAYQLQYLHTELSFDYQTKAHPSVIRKLYFLQIPSIEEQQKIAAVLTNADREIEVLEQQLADLQQEKKALMHQLLTGKKRVLVDL